VVFFALADKVSAGSFYSALTIVIGTVFLLLGFFTVDVNPAWTRKVNVGGTVLIALGTAFGYGSTFESYGKLSPGRSSVAVGVLIVVAVVGIPLTLRAAKKGRDASKKRREV
jgi:hypothetical protein